MTNITPYLDLAKRLGAPRIRVALKQESDIAHARRAADEAAEHGIQLVHQCHTLSLFETVESIERTLSAIDRPNFGLVYEPANLEICGQDYGRATIERLAKWIFNVYLQNQLLKPDGALMLPTWCTGDVSFDLIPIHAPGGVDFGSCVRRVESGRLRRDGHRAPVGPAGGDAGGVGQRHGGFSARFDLKLPRCAH